MNTPLIKLMSSFYDKDDFETMWPSLSEDIQTKVFDRFYQILYEQYIHFDDCQSKEKSDFKMLMQKMVEDNLDQAIARFKEEHRLLSWNFFPEEEKIQMLFLDTAYVGSIHNRL